MTAPLWTWQDLATAAAGITDGAPPAGIAGFSIDTRSLASGEMFIALTDQRDGHAFVPAAFKAGAAAALVSQSYARQPGDGPLLRVDDPLRALERIAIAARARLSAQTRVIAVTGSAGKTGTKEMLRAGLATCGAVHASTKSFNNHWGVPLTLASMPADTRFGVFEIGMNHAGEITPLTKLVRPHVAIVTNVLPVHIGHFDDGEIGIAHAKAEIFAGLAAGGVAIVPKDNPHHAVLVASVPPGRRIVSFGRDLASDVRLQAAETAGGGQQETARVAVELQSPDGNGKARTVRFELGLLGGHLTTNALAVVATLAELGCDLELSLAPLKHVRATAGRGGRRIVETAAGKILLIDESYNANPASMAAALATMGQIDDQRFARRIAVMGDMRELGMRGPELHLGLKEAVDRAGLHKVFACGLLMRHLFDTLAPAMRGAWAETSTELCAPLLEELRDGDVVMVKGSLGTNMAPIIAALSAHDSATKCATD